MQSHVNALTNPADAPIENEAQVLRATRWVVLLLCVAATATLIPLWEPLLLAAFLAVVADPLYMRLYRKVDGRTRAAALLTLLLTLVLLAPLVIATLSVYEGAADLLLRLKRANGGTDALRQLVATGSGSEPFRDIMSGPRLLELLRQNGMGAWTTARTVFGAATTLVLGLFIVAVGFYSFLTQGRRAYAWVLKRSPFPRGYGVRFGNAFLETGRGLLVGVGFTALIQGAIATVSYFAIGVSQAAVLGLLTVVAALIPSIGTGLVWAPVTLGLFLAGRHRAAVVMLAVGVFVSIIDNVIRPWLSRYGQLDLSPFLLLVAMLGGISAFGGFGLLLGPLFVRLAVEGLRLLHDERLDAPPGT
jgi:predicted PurR-regulated permease PerM